MPSYVALLRAVNLPAHNKVGMADLCKVATGLGFESARTLLASGNLVFRGDAGATAKLETALRAETKKRLGLDTDFFVRSVKEWDGIIAGNAFPSYARRDPSHLVVIVLQEKPGPKAEAALREAIVGREEVRVAGRHAYITYPDGIGTSKLTTALIERKLGTRGTARNWNTVQKLAAMMRE
jgi:uncharacterized protein (DUF1697 family)